MNELETYSVVIGIAIAIIQLTIAVYSLVANHRRQKKQATIDYLNQIREKYTEVDYELIGQFGTGPLDQATVKKIKADHTLWSKVMFLLGLIEHLAVGIHTNVFDLKVLNRMSGGYIIRIYKQFADYIESRRKSSPTVYIEFEQLVEKLKKLR